MFLHDPKSVIAAAQGLAGQVRPNTVVVPSNRALLHGWRRHGQLQRSRLPESPCMKVSQPPLLSTVPTG